MSTIASEFKKGLWKEIPPFRLVLGLCPVLAVKRLLRSRDLNKIDPLFAQRAYPNHTVIDNKVRDALRSVLNQIGLENSGHTFHAFRRSGAILAFNKGVPLEHVKAHGNWASDAVWSYLKAASTAPAVVPSLFKTLS